MENKFFTIKIANKIINIEHQYKWIEELCKNYVVDYGAESDINISITQDDINYEIEKNDNRLETKGIPKSHHSGEYWETIVCHRKIADAMLNYGIILIHGAAISIDEKGIIFLAKSGTGKTTHALNWMKAFPQTVIINGDKPLIDTNDMTIYGTPWSGKEAFNKNTSTKLSGISILNRGKDNFIKEISFAEALLKIIEQTHLPKDNQSVNKVMDCIHNLRKIPCYYLECNMNEESAVIAHELMIK